MSQDILDSKSKDELIEIIKNLTAENTELKEFKRFMESTNKLREGAKQKFAIFKEGYYRD